MPELPEVQTTVNDLKAHASGKRIDAVTVLWPRTIARPDVDVFVQTLAGQIIEDVTRRGKFIVIHLKAKKQKRFLLVHLRMSGYFYFQSSPDILDKHARVLFQLDSKQTLIFRDQRKFGKMYLVSDISEVTQQLGPEPLDISFSDFARRLSTRNGRIKSILLDQTFLSGIGNIYTDESLWYAKIHPHTPGRQLSRKCMKELHKAIRFVLQKAITLDGASFDQHYKRINGASGRYQNEFCAYSRKENPCLRCGTPIVKMVVGQRGTYICPVCQNV